MKNERNTIVVTGEQWSERKIPDRDREVFRSTQPKDDYLPPGPIPRSIRPRAREANLPPLLYLLRLLLFSSFAFLVLRHRRRVFFFFFFLPFFLLFFNYFPSCSLPTIALCFYYVVPFVHTLAKISFRSVFRSFASSKHRDAACF